ncbi:MAG: ArsR family transcriptional regulator [Cyanobacteriota bacterium]|nr:ArsR family transcriptional regulator [Cyanobacteriota bacterium]
MLNLFRQIKDGDFDVRKLLQSFFSRDRQSSQSSESWRRSRDLPPEIKQHARRAIQDLSPPPPFLETVREELDEAIQDWLDQPLEASNSLIVASNPVEAIARILQFSVEEWQPQSQIPIRHLGWTQRPSDPANLQAKLLAQLGRGLPLATKQQREIVVIPNLSWCFLRCAEGLEGIEYLRKAIVAERSRFWVIGCGTLAWNYLDLVCKIAAYYPLHCSLPQLNGEQLQAWLTPVVEEMGIDFGFLQKQAEESERESAMQEYFERLAAVSGGSSRVAVHLFMRSLVFQPSEEETDKKDEKDKKGEKESEDGTILAKNPRLPDLPNLSSDAHYLLYSLLLHGDMTLPHLADSLGDDEATVQHLVQNLRSTDTIEKQGEWLRVTPFHYPRLRNELDGNNFLMAEDNN